MGGDTGQVVLIVIVNIFLTIFTIIILEQVVFIITIILLAFTFLLITITMGGGQVVFILVHIRGIFTVHCSDGKRNQLVFCLGHHHPGLPAKCYALARSAMCLY